MPGAIVGGVAAVGGALISKSASDKASKAASNAAAENARIQQEQYNQTRSDLQPFTTLGYSAGNALSDRFGLTPGSQPSSYKPGVDYRQMLADNPDVQAWASADGDPTNDLEQADFWLNQYGRNDIATGLRPALKLEADPYTRPAYGERPQAPGAPSEASYFRDFEHSPGYQNILGEALRAVNVGQGAAKTYFSGGRGIALQGKAADLAAQDYGAWFNRQNSLYQSALGQYNKDREFANTNYEIDTTRQDARFDADRAYLTGRTDNRTNDLFKLLGTGAGATSALAGAGSAYAANMTANNNALAGAQGNAAIAGANSVNNLLGDAFKAYGMYRGGGPGGGSTPAGAAALSKVGPNGWNWS